jgi:methyl-accepting chemotaxis protein
MKEKRRKVWIDRFQTRLALRIAFYFAFYQAAVWALVLFERHVLTAMEAVFGASPSGLMVFLTALVVFQGLIFIYDAIRFSHRVVGPLYRLRKAIRAIADGEEIELVTLRQGDFLQELKDDFNAMVEALEERRAITLKQTQNTTAPIARVHR